MIILIIFLVGFRHLLKDELNVMNTIYTGTSPIITLENDVNLMMGYDKCYVTDIRYAENPVYTFKKKDIKTLMSAIFLKVISMFVKKLIIINNSEKTQNSSKRTSAFSSPNSKNSKENIAQKQSLEYKAYITIIEGKLDDLLKHFDVSTSIPPFCMT